RPAGQRTDRPLGHPARPRREPGRPLLRVGLGLGSGPAVADAVDAGGRRGPDPPLAPAPRAPGRRRGPAPPPSPPPPPHLGAGADPTVRAALERYAAGVNAYLESCRRGERSWPPELARLNERPADWKPEDSYLVLLGFGSTLDLDLPELGEARAVADHGAAWV